MRRPLAQVALAYTAGILLGAFLPLDLNPLLALTCGSAWAALFLGSSRSVLLWLALILTGWTNLLSRTEVLRPDDLRQTVGDRTLIVTVQGRLAATPVQRVYDARDELSLRTLAQVHVSSLRTKQGSIPATGTIVVSSPGVLSDEFYSGRAVEVSGVIRSPPGPVAEGLFDYRRHLKWQGIYYQLHVHGTNDWIALPSTQPRPFPDRFSEWARKTLARGLPVEDQPLKILWAMALGWDTGMTNEVAEPLMRSGTMHIVAISGLHIALIGGILIQILKLARVPRFACGWVVIPAIWFYTWVTGWQPSAIRSTIMTTVIVAGWSLKRPSNLINSLAASAFIILLWQPQQLFQVSFQLSFFVVLAIAVLMPPLEEVREWLLRPDPLVPASHIPQWKRTTQTCARALLSAMAVSLAAWVGSAPLIALYFHLLTPGSLIANLIVVPLSNGALACNMLSLCFGAWFPWMSEILNHSAWFFMQSVLVCSQWATTLPGAFWYVKSPSAVQIVVYYTVLMALLFAWERKWWNRRWFWIGIGAAVAVFAVTGKHARDDARITILSLGAGSAIYAESPAHRDNLLLDCGDERAADFVVKPYLRGQGVNRLPHFILTHGDVNNVGGALLIDHLFSPHDVITSELNFRSPAYRQTVAQLRSEHVNLRKIQRGERMGPWEVLHPASGDHAQRADDGCLVLRFDRQGKRVLLLSDLARPGQKQLVERERDLRADILIGGMPAYEEPLSESFLDAVQPQVIILATGAHPAHQIPKRALRERLAKRRIPILYTGDLGSLTVIFSDGGWKVVNADGKTVVAQQE